MHRAGLPVWATKLITPPDPLYSAGPELRPVTTPSPAIIDAVWEYAGVWKQLTASAAFLQSVGDRLSDEDYDHAAKLAAIAGWDKLKADGGERGIARAVRAQLDRAGAVFATFLEQANRTLEAVLEWQRTDARPSTLPPAGETTYGDSLGGCVVGAGMMVAGGGILATTVVAIVASDGAALPLAPTATTLGTGLFTGGAAVIASQCF
jgi:hypothetical protein